MKKFISKVLICAMLISVLPKTSFAHEEKINTTTVSEEQKAKTEKVEKKEEVKAEEKVEKKEEVKAEEKSERKEEVKTETKLEQSVIASPIKARATEPRYSVEFHFDPIPDSKQLPQAIIDKLPEDKTNVEDGTVINLPSFADEVVEDKGGLWKFEPDPEKYNVTFHFVTLTLVKELPTEVLTKKPANQSDLPSGTVIPLPKFEDVKVEGGTWKFRYWYLSLGDYGHEVENEITVENADLFLIGGWEFEKDPEPKKYDVTFSFESETPGKELPDEIKAKIPADQLGVPDGTLIHLPKYDSVKVEGGTWEFVHWRIEIEGKDDDFSLGIDKFVNGTDMKMVGIWKFEEDPKPEKYNVEFQFYSVTKGKELPDEIKAKLPANKTDVPNGTEIPLPNYEDVKVKGGTWKFLGWYSIKGAEHNKVENKVVVDNDNLYLLGQWKFEADKKPQPKPQKPKVQKGRILPKTNVESAFTYVVLALAGICGAYIAKKKDNE